MYIMHYAITTQIGQQRRADLQVQAQATRLSRQARSASSRHNMRRMMDRTVGNRSSTAGPTAGARERIPSAHDRAVSVRSGYGSRLCDS